MTCLLTVYGCGKGPFMNDITQIIWRFFAPYVVYFDQRMHACPCICIVENDKNALKLKKNIFFSSCVRETHVRLFYRFQPCERLHKHAFTGRNTQLQNHFFLFLGCLMSCFLPSMSHQGPWLPSPRART